MTSAKPNAAQALQRVFEDADVPQWSQFVIAVLCEYINEHDDVDELRAFAKEYVQRHYSTKPLMREE